MKIRLRFSLAPVFLAKQISEEGAWKRLLNALAINVWCFYNFYSVTVQNHYQRLRIKDSMVANQD